MAVVQISRIQNRRGLKNSQTGFPQLASGELGWALDTQELYIGNGAVSEGAPAVGNTKILTEHDDLFNYVTSYEYAYNDSSITTGVGNFPTVRTLQDRLDDTVSVRSFGAVGDGTTDDTVALQRAIDQLFLNSATKNNYNSRVLLYIEPGEYMVTNTLYIPPYAHLIGSGVDSTVIRHKPISVIGTIQTTSTTTTVTNLSTVSGLKVGMVLSASSGTGKFGGHTSITSIDTVNKTISILSTSANTVGQLTFLAIGNYPLMQTVDANSTPGNYTSFSNMSYLQRPRRILMQDLTLSKSFLPTGNSANQTYTLPNGTVYTWNGSTWVYTTSPTYTDSPILYLDNTDSSVFDRVKFQGSFINGTNPALNQSGVIMRGLSGVFHTENILFHYCSFDNTGYGVYSESDHNNVSFDSCRFYQLYDALNIGGNTSGSFVVNTTATATSSSDNTITVGSTTGMFVGMPISFAGSVSFGGIVLKQTYYIASISGSTKITISNYLGGATLSMTDGSGIITLVSTNAVGASNTKVSSCYFDLIDRYGLWVKLGQGNTSIGNKFMNVGNMNEGYGNATYPIIQFDTDNNQSVGDYFDRNTMLKDQNSYGLISFVPNVKGSGSISDITNFRKVLPNPNSYVSAVPQPFFRLPLVNSSNIVLDYVINKTTSGIATRTGRLHITVDLANIIADINDDFSYTGDSSVENVSFSTELHNYNGDGTTFTLLILLYNSQNNGSGTVSYSYRALSL
jgi:Pectate lyase superfamily protein/Major tropism determinant N-terminal domain